jgi:maltose O-acetyltransferase
VDSAADYAACVNGQQLAAAVRDEFSFDLRPIIGRLLIAPLPSGSAARVRAMLLRATGLAVGDRTLLMSRLTVIGGKAAWRNLAIGEDCFINQDCVFDATAPIVIGNNVNFGHGVLVTTSSHRIGTAERRAGLLEPQSVRIGDGAWVSSRAVVLPGVDIGDGAIVGAGAVVTRSVPAHTMVAGVPAREVKRLDATAAAR